MTKGLGPIQKVNTGPYFLDNSINSTLECLLVPRNTLQWMRKFEKNFIVKKIYEKSYKTYIKYFQQKAEVLVLKEGLELWDKILPNNRQSVLKLYSELLRVYQKLLNRKYLLKNPTFSTLIESIFMKYKKFIFVA